MDMNTVQVVFVAVLLVLIHVFNVLVLRPTSLRAKLHRQGIHGPSPHFYFGNSPEMKTLLLQVQSALTTQVKDKDEHVSLSQNGLSLSSLTFKSGSANMLSRVIQETLRLYSPAAFVVKTALQDVTLKGMLIPKGMNIQIPISVLQQDPQLWGPDARKFNQERFANGVIEACKVPQAYIAIQNRGLCVCWTTLSHDRTEGDFVSFC